MLLERHPMMKFAVTAALVCVCSAAQAAEPTAKPEADTSYIPYGNLQNASPEELARAKALGQSVAKELLEAYATVKVPEVEKTTKALKRRADDIADEAMAAERDKMMDFLGLDPQSDTALYYFVSWSMPIDMLRSYAIEAMWSGGSLIFRGVPPGKELGDFILKDLHGLVYGKGASAHISIDPRLFDSYAVTTVPTIVFTKVRANMSCQGINPVPFEFKGQALSYDTCPALDPSKYYKLTGAVTTNYALQAFIDDGVKEAQPYLSALSRGWIDGNTPGKAQKPFVGTWESVLSPAERQASKDMANIVTTPAGAPR